jgi:hypothetical protein
MCSVLIERHGLGGAAVDFGTSTFDLGIPGCSGICVLLTVQASNQLERQARTFLGRKPENLRQYVRDRHVVMLADDVGRR